MKKNSTPLVDEHLQTLQGMQEAETDDFFYTRLKERMVGRQADQGKGQSRPGWNFPLKPAWVISTLVLLLAVNGFILSQQFKSNKTKGSDTSTSLESFAKSYDQTIASSY